MQAGVVRQKTCKIDFQCEGCGFHRALNCIARKNRELRSRGISPKGKQGTIIHWRERLKEQPLTKRPCIHSMKQKINFRACTNEYRCSDCEFDQYFMDQFAVHAVIKPMDILDIDGFKIPQGYYLHKGHAWMKLEEGSEVRIGLDDFALRLLGPFDSIESPLLGMEVKQDRADIAMNRGSHKAKLLSPVSGVITAANPGLRTEAGHAGENPYSESWVIRVHATDLRRDIKNLMIGDEAGVYYKNELDCLHRVIAEEAGPLAADGGYFSENIFGHMPELGWDKLTKTFLRS